MGNSSIIKSTPLLYDRNLYITLNKYSEVSGTFSSYYIYHLKIGHKGYYWIIKKRYHEFKLLDKYLRKKYIQIMNEITFPSTSIHNFSGMLSNGGLTKRGNDLVLYLETISSNDILFNDQEVKLFLEIGATSFDPSLGRKGKSGYLRKCSGGYIAVFPGSESFLKTWSTSWIVAHETHLGLYANQDSIKPEAILKIDTSFSVSSVGRYISITTATRRLTLYAPTVRIANEWVESLREFYLTSPRAIKTILCTTAYPIRFQTDDINIFITSKDYYFQLAVELLKAKEEIFITAKVLSTDVILTRPPLPPTKLENLLKYKVDQGVKLYVLLNKQSKQSTKLKHLFLNYGPNVQCIRHSDKSQDGTILTHNEKIIVIDRSIAFIGGLDIALGRYDDSNHTLEDENGVNFPGGDYRQYSPNLLIPVRNPNITTDKSRTNIEPNNSISLVEAHATSVDATFVPDVSIDSSFRATELDISTHSIIYPPDYQHHQQQPQQPPQQQNIDQPSHIYGEEEGYGLPETEQEALARMEAESYAQAMPVQELDVVGQPQNNQNSNNGGGFLGGLLGLFGQLGDILEDVIGGSNRGDSKRRPLRELYPRQPWHDIHVKVTGVAGRDISSYFVQRWNYNRLAKGELDQEVLSDITDNQYFFNCSRCGLSNLHETVTTCPGCQLSFGSTSKYLKPTLSTSDPLSLLTLKLPDLPSVYSFIVFECKYTTKLGCNLTGEGPTIIENVLEIPLVNEPGVLLHSQGEYSQCLIERGLYASIGDIFLAIDGIAVGHLGLFDVKRLLTFKFSNNQSMINNQVTVVFRRHYIQAVVNSYRSANISKSSNFTTAMQSFDSSAISQQQPRIQYKDPNIDLTQNKIDQYSNPTQNEQIYPIPTILSTNNVTIPTIPTITTLPSEQYSFESKISEEEKINHIPITTNQSIHSQEEDIPDLTTTQFYPSLPGVASVAPSMPVPFTSVTPIQNNITIPLKVEESPQIYTEINSTTTESISPQVVTEIDQPIISTISEQSHFESLGINYVNSNITLLEPNHEISHNNTISNSESINLNFNLPEVPTQQPLILPEVPTHIIHVTTDASRRGVENIESEPIETIDRAVAMSGKNSNQSPTPIYTPIPTVAAPAPTLTSPILSQSQNQSQNQYQSSISFPSYPNLPVTNTSLSTTPSPPSISTIPTVVATSVDSGRRDSVESTRGRTQRGSSIIIPQQILRVSPLYTPESIFPPNHRTYACQEAELIERRLCYSILVHETPLNTQENLQSLKSCEVQFLRSGGLWSIGEADNSIHHAYVKAIESSNHLIYIENQFFIGNTESSEFNQNSVFVALLKRLIKAVQNSEHFRVIIILPLHPIGDFVNHEVPRTILLSEYLTISQGGKSLLEMFAKNCPNVDPSQYICFYSLRNWGVMNEKIITEQIYVHSKIMIVDDRIIIIGSANLTDRSLVGYQDSEVGIRIEDGIHQTIQLGGKPWEVGSLPHNLRISLMKQHLGYPLTENNNSNTISSIDLIDMALHSPQYHDPFNMFWNSVAGNNSQIYDYLDGPLSPYHCTKFDDYRRNLKIKVLPSYFDETIRQSVHRIQGHLINWPIGFLRDENLTNILPKKYTPPVHMLLNE